MHYYVFYNITQFLRAGWISHLTLLKMSAAVWRVREQNKTEH